MLGWLSCAAASASLCSSSSRSTTCDSRPGLTALKATSRPSWRSRASNTTPQLPRPISRTSSNRPMTAPGTSTRRQARSKSSDCTPASRFITAVIPPGATRCTPSVVAAAAVFRESAGSISRDHMAVGPEDTIAAAFGNVTRRDPIETTARESSLAGDCGTSGEPSSNVPLVEPRSV